MLEIKNYNPDVLSCLANLSNDEVFTPPELANQILDLLPPEIWNNKTVTFLDPVCKSGVFLREIAKRLLKGLDKEIPNQQVRMNHIFTKQLYGIAITELTSLLSRRSVYCSKTANGRYSIVDTFESQQGNIKFDRIEHTWKNDKCTFCGASESEYKREVSLETYAYELIHTHEPETIFDMKFDVIVGNPPYQLSDGGHGTSAKPIYHHFVEKAKQLNPRYLSMIIPARWYSGGKGLDNFRAEMLSDKRIRQIHDFPEATDVFPGVQIKGGICYFLWERDNEGDCLVSTYEHGNVISKMERPLLMDGCENFIRYNEAISILKKVQKFSEDSMREQVSSRKPFGLSTTFRGKTRKFKESIKIYQNGGTAYCKDEDIRTNRELIKYYKVLIAPLGSGSDSFPHQLLGMPFIAEPNTACTETYLVAGISSSERTAENLKNYLKTKFLRFLVLLNKPTQHATSKVYSYVPKQNFKEEWNDEKLYLKYGISQEEQDFIDSLIRPME
ncbi:Eco57I restriction-modification methylase domain-containing protein [Pricia sp.]|uniref:Eco57I restriction-modification methylase domain-containing protein n=1 Tax=Pricia sp. TaxID=2268138 RepID=UPI003593FA34